MTLIMLNSLGININVVCDSMGIQNKTPQISHIYSPEQQKQMDCGPGIQLLWINKLLIITPPTEYNSFISKYVPHVNKKWFVIHWFSVQANGLKKTK